MLRVAIGGWLVLFCLTVALTIAALATEHWMVLGDKETGNDLDFGLWYTKQASLSSCEKYQVILATKEKVHDKIQTDVVAGLLITAAVFDLISLFLGISFYHGRETGKYKGLRMSIPTLVTVFVAADFILIGNLVFLWDIRDTPAWIRPTHNRNCTSVHTVNLTTKTDFSFFLAVAAAACHVLKAVIFILVTYWDHAKNGPRKPEQQMSTPNGDMKMSKKEKNFKPSDLEANPGTSEVKQKTPRRKGRKGKQPKETHYNGKQEESVKGAVTAVEGAENRMPATDRPQESTPAVVDDRPMTG